MPFQIKPFDVIWACLLFAVGAVLCFVPLFNLLAFEFAFALGIPVTICAGALGVRAQRASAASPMASPWRAWARAGLRATALAAIPLLPISLNALRVRNCDYLEGLAFYAVLPGLGAWIAAGLGVAIGRIAPRRGIWLFLLFFVASIGVGVARFWWQPPVDAFHLFLGYYPGSLYDEVVDIGRRLLASRAEDLGLAALAVALAATRRGQRLQLVVAVAIAAGTSTLAWLHDIHRSTGWVQRALGGHRATEHLDIYHPAGWSKARVDALATDLEFAYAELAAFLAVTPAERPAIYLYADVDSKKRLMGAGTTRIAKPWQRAMHLHGLQVGDPVAIHELAHVFSAELADGPLHLSLRGLLPHMGLIEGLAVAATWESGRLDGHQWSAAMHQVDAAPPLERLLSPTGFLAANSRTAYTLCGSFVKFIHDTEGPEAVAATYRAGGIEPPERLTPLVAAWQAHLATQPLDPRALADARNRFDRPAIFHKVCAHEVAALRRDAGKAIQRGRADEALAINERLLGHVPGDTQARLLRVSLLLAQGQTAKATEFAREIADDERAGAVVRGRAHEWLADLDAAAGRLEPAGAAYDALLAQTYDREQIRRLAVKRAVLSGGPAGPPILALLTAPPGTPEAQADALLDQAAAAEPTRPLVQYLVGRRHIRERRRDEGITVLQAALDGGLAPSALRFEARRLIGKAHFDRRRYLDAARTFQALAQDPDPEIERGERFGLDRWARRAQFFASHSVDKDPGPLEDAADFEASDESE